MRKLLALLITDESDELVGSIARRTVTAVADHRDVPAAAAHVMLQQENSGYPVFEVTL